MAALGPLAALGTLAGMPGTFVLGGTLGVLLALATLGTLKSGETSSATAARAASGLAAEVELAPLRRGVAVGVNALLGESTSTAYTHARFITAHRAHAGRTSSHCAASALAHDVGVV